jgi:hypothetical protein
MAAWFFELPVIWMAVVIFAATYVVAAAVFWVPQDSGATNNRGLLSPIGVVFGLLVVFTAAQGCDGRCASHQGDC